MFFGNGLIDKLSALASWRDKIRIQEYLAQRRKGAKFGDFQMGIIIVKIS